MRNANIQKDASIRFGAIAAFAVLIGCSGGNSNSPSADSPSVSPASNASAEPDAVTVAQGSNPSGAPVSQPVNSEVSINGASTASIAGLWDISSDATEIVMSISADNSATFYQPDQSGQCLVAISGSLVLQQDSLFLFTPGPGQVAQSFSIDAVPDGAGNLVLTDPASRMQSLILPVTDVTQSQLDALLCAVPDSNSVPGTDPVTGPVSEPSPGSSQGTWFEQLGGLTIMFFDPFICINFRANGTFRQEFHFSFGDIDEEEGTWTVQGQFPNEVGVGQLVFNGFNGDGRVEPFITQIQDGRLFVSGQEVSSNRVGCTI